MGTIAIVMVFWGLAYSPWGIPGALGHGPFGGEEHAVARVQADAPGPGDATAIRARLGALGVRAEVIEAGSGTLSLTLGGEADVAEVLDAALRPRRLALRRAFDEPADRPPDALRVEHCDGDGWCEEAWIGAVVMDGRHVAGAEAVRTDSGTAAVWVTFTAEGREVFGRWTTALVGRPFAILIDDRLRSAPVVREPILGGRAMILVDEGFEEARVLAAALTHPVQGDWRVVP